MEAGVIFWGWYEAEVLDFLLGKVAGGLLVGTWAAASRAIRLYERHGFSKKVRIFLWSNGSSLLLIKPAFYEKIFLHFIVLFFGCSDCRL